MRYSTLSCGIAAALAAGSAGTASAGLVLDLDFGRFDQNVPTNSLFGGGNTEQVVRAAADYWVDAFRDSPEVVTQDLEFTWGPSGALATGGTAWSGTRLVGGGVNFDSDGSTNWFVDATPFASSEYNRVRLFTADFGGGTMNVGRNPVDANTDAAREFDMLSVAIHEIGHALGLLGGYDGYEAAVNGDGDPSTLDVTAPRPFAGSRIPAAGGHIPLDHVNMGFGIGAGERKLLSEADILTLAQTLGFSQVNLNPLAAPVPEPSSAFLVGLAATGLLARRRKQVGN